MFNPDKLRQIAFLTFTTRFLSPHKGVRLLNKKSNGQNKNNITLEKHLTISQCCQVLGNISKATIRNWIKSGKIKRFVKIANRILVPESAIKQLLKTNQRTNLEMYDKINQGVRSILRPVRKK